MDTTAGFTCVTNAEKSGSACAGSVIVGGLTGPPASGAARTGDKPPSAVPASRAAVNAVRRNVWVMGILLNGTDPNMEDAG